VIYGGLFVGLMCHMEYNVVFPLMFGTENTLTTFVSKVLFDNFVSAPLMWLPPAYLIKAMLYDYSLMEGIQKYWKDIRDEDLLQKYWTIWVPAQTVSFSVVPDHLRVAFMAAVSFFWFILFSSVSSNSDGDDNVVVAAADSTMIEDSVAAATSIDTQIKEAGGPTSIAMNHPALSLGEALDTASIERYVSFEALHDLYHQDIGVFLDAEVNCQRVVSQKEGRRRTTGI
jgi:Mpv17 / PMP22 family